MTGKQANGSEGHQTHEAAVQETGESDKYSIIASAKRQADPKEALNAKVGSEGGSKKARTAVPAQSSSSSSVTLAPLFRRSMQTASGEVKSSSLSKANESLFSWKKSLGRQGSCLRAEYGKPFARAIEERPKQGKERHLVRIACFDLDGCLVRPKEGRKWPSASDPFDYMEAFHGAFARVKKEYEEGSCIAIITNQDQNNVPNSKRLTTWKSKITNIARAIDCPMLILAAISKDGFRKPGRAMWDEGVVGSYVEAGGEEEDILKQDTQDMKASFFVGDAAGRSGDHADTDRKWATNVGIPFYTPEEVFLGQKPRPYKLSGWRPVLDEAHSEKHDTPLPTNFFTQKPDTLDLVLFVGPPASGKTTFFQKFFAPQKYERVNQDTLKTAAKCLTVARTHLKAGRSVVIDNTNRSVATRAPYVEMARELEGLDIQVRCIFFDIAKELCQHNNAFRVRAGLQSDEEPREMLPALAFGSYFTHLEPPERKEGFGEDVVVVKWSFRADEEAKRRWLQQWD